MATLGADPDIVSAAMQPASQMEYGIQEAKVERSDLRMQAQVKRW